MFANQFIRATYAAAARAVRLIVISGSLFGSGCIRHEINYAESDLKLVALYLDHPNREPEPAYVTSRFAALMIWRGWETSFYLYDNASRKILHTADFGEFLLMLEQLPSYAVIQRLDTCCTSLVYDMPETEHRRLERPAASVSAPSIPPSPKC